MDLRSILNFDDRPKLSARSSQASRMESRSRQNRSSTGKMSIHSMANSVKIESNWSEPLTPMTSPSSSICSTGVPWMQSMSPAENSSSYPVSNRRTSSGNRPRITTSNISTSSATTKRRASGYSPVSLSSSSCSSPSPPTPSSMLSTGLSCKSVSSGAGRQHKSSPSSGRPRPESSGSLPRFHQIVTQPPHVISVIPDLVQSTHGSHVPRVHMNRVLPLPVGRRPNDHSSVQQCPLQQHISPPNPTEHKSQTQTIQTSGQRVCSAAVNCDYTTPKRRIVSQFFGRNKKETRLIPRHCWVFYCRQHYQRSRYRLCTTRFADLQMSLVRATITALEAENIVLCWEIKLRKRALEKITKSERDTKGSSSSSKKSSSGNNKSTPYCTAASNASCARERLLLPFCGERKSFEHVYEVLDVVKEICKQDGGSALEFELLPTFSQDYQAREEERRRACRAAGDGSDSESGDDDD